jgi:N-terminal acetyltransferase 2
MPPVSASVSRLLRQQAQSILQTNSPSLAINRSLRQPLQQTRTILTQQCSRSTRTGGQIRAQRPSRYANKTYNQHKNPFFQQRFSSSSANASGQQTQTQSQSLSQRLKTLTREYGWSALGVYLTLSALDFPFCFAAVRLLGVERIGHYEHLIIENIKKLYYSVVPLERHTGAEGEVEGEQHEHITDEGASMFLFPHSI